MATFTLIFKIKRVIKGFTWNPFIGIVCHGENKTLIPESTLCQ
jgi:hypothetical protein